MHNKIFIFALLINPRCAGNEPGSTDDRVLARQCDGKPPLGPCATRALRENRHGDACRNAGIPAGITDPTRMLWQREATQEAVAKPALTPLAPPVTDCRRQPAAQAKGCNQAHPWIPSASSPACLEEAALQAHYPLSRTRFGVRGARTCSSKRRPLIRPVGHPGTRARVL
jgi:hypothetical protein